MVGGAAVVGVFAGAAVATFDGEALYAFTAARRAGQNAAAAAVRTAFTFP